MSTINYMRQLIMKLLVNFEMKAQITKSQFIGLRSKLYSCVTDDNIPHEKCKGIKICVIKQELEHKNCKTCLNNHE